MSFDFSSLPINGADLTFTVILLLSGVLAFFRGAVREVLAIGGWMAAVAASYYGFDYVRPYIVAMIGVPMVAVMASIGGGCEIRALLVTSLPEFDIPQSTGVHPMPALSPRSWNRKEARPSSREESSRPSVSSAASLPGRRMGGHIPNRI